MNMRRPIVSVHSIRRFAERCLGVTGLPEQDEAALVALRSVHGFDTVQIERMLATAVRTGVETGAQAVLVAGCRFVLDGRVLVTVIPNDRFRRRRVRIERDVD